LLVEEDQGQLNLCRLLLKAIENHELVLSSPQIEGSVCLVAVLRIADKSERL
jgi:hypothetical protein